MAKILPQGCAGADASRSQSCATLLTHPVPKASPEQGPQPRLGISDHWITHAIWIFVALGILMRVLRYLLRFPLWSDEAALAANLLDRDYLDLLRPLDYQQVAPPLFMWIELWITQQLGFHEWS